MVRTTSIMCVRCVSALATRPPGTPDYLTKASFTREHFAGHRRLVSLRGRVSHRETNGGLSPTGGTTGHG
jgi:hypothetical protein